MTPSAKSKLTKKLVKKPIVAAKPTKEALAQKAKSNVSKAKALVAKSVAAAKKKISKAPVKKVVSKKDISKKKKAAKPANKENVAIELTPSQLTNKLMKGINNPSGDIEKKVAAQLTHEAEKLKKPNDGSHVRQSAKKNFDKIFSSMNPGTKDLSNSNLN